MKKFILSLIILFLVVIILGITFLYIPNTQKTAILHIPKNASFQQVTDSLLKHRILKNNLSFKLVAHAIKYPHYISRGKYNIDKGENNLNLIKKLYRGQHYPVKFTFNNIRTKEQFVQKTEEKFLFSHKELLQLVNDSTFLKQYGFTPQTVISIFIPNTYEFYYDIDATDFFEKMYGYYNSFWNEKRVKSAEEIGLTPVEVITLASIVEEENFREAEKAIIAGVYINRLRKGMKLQADPTVKFAVGDFTLKRILSKHLEVDSPYNTYINEGLPPGPIRIPESSTIDSVLHYRRHSYIFMCAKPDLSGYHNFTSSAIEHLRNAAQYQRAIK